MMKFNLKKKTLMLGGLAVLLVATAVTYALLSTKSQQNVNEFSGAYGQVNISVIENDGKDTPSDLEDEIESGDKSNNTVIYDKVNTTDFISKEVKVKNFDKPDYKTTDTYVRVKLVPQLVSDKDSSEVYAGSVKLIYQMNTDADDKNGMWKYHDADDTFYYTRALAPNEITVNLLEGVKLAEGAIPEGYHLELNVLADGIIANPIENLYKAWGLNDVNGDYFGELTNVNSTMTNK